MLYCLSSERDGRGQAIGLSAGLQLGIAEEEKTNRGKSILSLLHAERGKPLTKTRVCFRERGPFHFRTKFAQVNFQTGTASCRNDLTLQASGLQDGFRVVIYTFECKYVCC